MGDENFMATFITGLVILLLGGWLYGKFVEHVFKPDDRETPAVRMKDGIDYVPMNKWKNALINLLNIAGTGPILVDSGDLVWTNRIYYHSNRMCDQRCNT